MGLPGLRQRGFLPQAKPLGPFQPGRAAVFFLQRHKQGVIRQPLGIFLKEGLIGIIRGKPAVGQTQELAPLLIQLSEADPTGVAAPVDRLRLPLLQQSLLHQRIQIDEIGIAGKGGKGLVWRIAEARGIQGQNLPDRLARLRKKIHEMIGLLSHGSHAVRPGQGSDVH